MGFGERLRDSSQRHGSRIILALDLLGEPETRAQRAASLLERLGDQVAGVKLNFHVILPTGVVGLAPITSICRRKGLPLIADIKLNDIESTNIETMKLLFEGGFDALIANPFVGAKEGLSKVISEGQSMDKGVLLLVYMSHAGAEEGYGMKVGGVPMYVRFAKKVRDWHADGAIVSSKSLAVIRRVRTILRPGQLVLSPGVGFQGGEAARAMRAGTDFAIVGRSIIGATNQLAALEGFNSSVPKTSARRQPR